jgi:hypothetical protein
MRPAARLGLQGREKPHWSARTAIAFECQLVYSPFSLGGPEGLTLVFHLFSLFARHELSSRHSLALGSGSDIAGTYVCTGGLPPKSSTVAVENAFWRWVSPLISLLFRQFIESSLARSRHSRCALLLGSGSGVAG